MFLNALGGVATSVADRTSAGQARRRLFRSAAVLPFATMVRESVFRVRWRPREIAEVPTLQASHQGLVQRLQVHWDEHGAIAGRLSPVDMRGPDK